jgi:uncharacterized protein DUF6647
MKPNIDIENMMKSFMVHPCVIEGQQTLVFEQGLEEKHPSAYQTLVHYAKANDCVIKEDRRADFIEGVKRVKDPSHANVITIMILTASILSQTALADDLDFINQANVDDEVDQVQSYPRVDLQATSFATSDQLMAGLFEWINEHTTFEHNIEHLPKLSFGSPQNIAVVAFGGELPAEVDATKLNILGLYNFNNKTIYLLDSVDLKTEVGRGVLLHELVHYLQYEEQLDKNVDCKNELEALAYTIEAQYLHEHNQDSEFSKQLIKDRSECSS